MPTQQALLDLEFDMNNLKDAQSHKHQIGSKMARQQKLILVAQYDFSVQGGVIGTINLKDPLTGKDAKLPKGAIITNAIIHTLTNASTGSSPTIAVGTGAATNDIKAATASSSYATSALLAGIPVGTAATAVVLAADQTPSMTIAVANLTAGKFNVIFEYYLSLP